MPLLAGAIQRLTFVGSDAHVLELEDYVESYECIAELPEELERRVEELRAEWRALEEPTVQVPVVAPPKVGRNEACPCGSGKKHKKCCLLKDAAQSGT